MGIKALKQSGGRLVEQQLGIPVFYVESDSVPPPPPAEAVAFDEYEIVQRKSDGALLRWIERGA